jgi:hypothetical protein
MKEIFTYMFKDNMFTKKAAILFLLLFIALAICGIPPLLNSVSYAPTVEKVSLPYLHYLPSISCFLDFAIYGYMMICIKAIIQQDLNIVLPFFNFKNSLIRGLKFFVVILIFTLLSVFIYSILLFLLVPLKALCVLPILKVLITIAVVIYVNALLWIFANEDKIFSLLAFRKATKLIKQNLRTYFSNLGLIFVINFISAFLSCGLMYILDSIFDNNYLIWILSTLEGTILAGYMLFINAYLIAKSIKPETVV